MVMDLVNEGEEFIMYFCQMSGFPGSGKSTLARLIAKNTNAIVIDHDIVKTAFLESIDQTIDANSAGRVSYHIEWSLIDFYLSQGQNVILDSPCLYTEMIEKGTNLTNKYKTKYKYVECYLNDMDEINSRLKNRKRLISQIEQITSEEGFNHAINNSKKPANVRSYIVNSDQPIENYIDEVIKYILE
jgi:predicted kinase